MSIVSAYTEWDKFTNFHWDGSDPYLYGEYLNKSDSGLEVDWGGSEPPENAQVYLYWEPQVVAIWEEENKDESDGTEVEHTGSQDSEEPDNGGGEAGGGVGEEPTAAGTVSG